MAGGTNEDDAPQETPEQRFQRVQDSILELLYRAFPKGAVSGSWPVMQLRSAFGDPLFRQAVTELQEAGLVTVTEEPGADGVSSYRLFIRPDGIRAYGQRRPGTTWAELNRLNQIITDQVATLAGTIESNREEQQNLARTVDAVREQLGRDVQAVQEKITHAERDFYARILPFFAAFVAAFALIITGTQIVTRNLAPDGQVATLLTSDPVRIVAVFTAMLAPLAVLVGALVWWTWWLTRRR